NLELVPHRGNPSHTICVSTCRTNRERVSLLLVTAVESETPLSAPLDVGFDYTRSVGPVLGRFMTELTRRRIGGGRGTDGRVHVPPVEYDPTSAEPLTEFVRSEERRVGKECE